MPHFLSSFELDQRGIRLNGRVTKLNHSPSAGGIGYSTVNKRLVNGKVLLLGIGVHH